MTVEEQTNDHTVDEEFDKQNRDGGTGITGSSGSVDEAKERLRWQRYQVYVTGASCLIAFVALVFVSQQVVMAIRSSHTSATSLSASEKTAEMQYNLQVMERLDDMLLKTGSIDDCYNYVWADQVSHLQHDSEPIQCGDSIIDALSLALKAVNSLPCFSQNGEDWASYARYLMKNSDSLRHRVLDTVDKKNKNDAGWWPEVLPYAQNTNYDPPVPSGSAACK